MFTFPFFRVCFSPSMKMDFGTGLEVITTLAFMVDLAFSLIFSRIFLGFEETAFVWSVSGAAGAGFFTGTAGASVALDVGAGAGAGASAGAVLSEAGCTAACGSACGPGACRVLSAIALSALLSVPAFFMSDALSVSTA